MNVLKSIEKRMEKMVEGLFGKAFKSSVQPVELAHKLAKEMGDHKTVSVSRVYVPNSFAVYLSPDDYAQLHAFEGALVEELASYLIAYARRESWTLVAKPAIVLHSDTDLSLGEFGIATGADGEAQAAVGPAPVTPPLGLVSKAPAGMSQTVVFQPPAAPDAVGAEDAASLPPSAVSPPSPPEVPPSAVPPTAVSPVTPPAPLPLSPPVAEPGPHAAEAESPSPAPRVCGALVVGDRTHLLSNEVTVLGRSRQCDVAIADPNVSRRHAEVRREGAEYVVIDLDSTNGILVNGREVRRAALAEGDKLQLGSTLLRFERRPC